MRSLAIMKLVILSILMIGCTSGKNEVSAQSSDAQADVVLTEYSDYQCPACAYYNPIVEELKKEFGDQLKVEYRFFPLNGHQYGALSARVAQAAKNQDKFMEMHNKLFENQQRWSSHGNPQDIFVNYAREIGLDVEQFKKDMNAADTQRTVMEDKEQGQAAGVNATPTFFINGDKIEQNPRNIEEFKQLVKVYIESVN